MKIFWNLILIFIISTITLSCIESEEKVITIAIKINENVILFCLILFIKLIRLIQ